MSANRKERLLRNLGRAPEAAGDERFTEPFFDGPAQTEMRTSIVLPERLIKTLLLAEVTRLSENEDECRRFFSHFFDPSLGDDVTERESYVRSLTNDPPRVVLGYPRSTGTWPCFAVVNTQDEEADDRALAKYFGETLSGESVRDDAEYEGGFFDQSVSVFVYATNPDQALLLYYLAKFILFGGRDVLTQAGLIDPSYHGGELNAEEMFLPANVFARVLAIKFLVTQTIPKLLRYRDGRRLRVGGIFREDVVVDGQRGGVKTYEPGESENGEES